MKNKFILLLLLSNILFFASVKAQNVAISNASTTPNSASILDLRNSATLGLLLPRTGTSSLPATVALAAQGLLFFNTSTNLFNVNTSSGTSTTFVPLGNSPISNVLSITTAAGASITSTVNGVAASLDLTPAISATPLWTTSGNSITAASSAAYGVAVNNTFIGTSNTKDLVFAAGGIEGMRIVNVTGNIGVGTAAPVSTLEIGGSFASNEMIYNSTSTTNTIGTPSANVYYVSSTQVLPYSQSASKKSNYLAIILPTVASCSCNNRRYVIVNDAGSLKYIYFYTSSAYSAYSYFTNLAGSATTYIIAPNTSIEIIADNTTSQWLQIK